MLIATLAQPPHAPGVGVGTHKRAHEESLYDPRLKGLFQFLRNQKVAPPRPPPSQALNHQNS